MRSTEGPPVWARLGTIAAAALIALTACGSNASTGGSTAKQPPTYNIAPPTKVGAGEGALSLIDWPGYVDRTNWQTPSVASFESQTGCKISVKDANTSDEMVTLMSGSGGGGGGPYDHVSASGDADPRLIYGGDGKPMNTDLIPGLKSLQTHFT